MWNYKSRKTCEDGRVVSKECSLWLLCIRWDAVPLELLHNIGKCESQMGISWIQHEVFGIQINKRAQKHVGWMCSQLPRLPQVLLGYTANYDACKQENGSYSRLTNTNKLQLWMTKQLPLIKNSWT